MISTIAPIVVLVLAAATYGSAFRSTLREWRIVNAVSWLGAVGGFAYLQFDAGTTASLSVAVSTAALVALAVLRPSGRAPEARRVGLGFGVLVPAMLAMVCLTGILDAASSWPRQIVVFTASWAATCAGLAVLMSAAGRARGPVGPGIGLAAAGAAGAALIAGTGRSSLPEAFYGFPLSTVDGPLQWILPPVPGFETGLRLAVAAPVPNGFFALATIAGLGVLTAAALWSRRSSRLSIAGLFALAGAAGAFLMSIGPTSSGLARPDATPYSEYVKQLLLNRNVGDRVQILGDWSSADEIFVSLALMAPEIFALGFCSLVGIVGALSCWQARDLDHPVDDRWSARDDAARGVALLWLGWLVALLVHEALLGSPGLGAPGEWAHVGVLVTGTGLLGIGWAPRNRLTELVGEVSAGVIVALVFLAAGFAFRFGALFGFSVGIM